MLKIAFVDDDRKILEELRDFLPWQDYGIEVSGLYQLPHLLLAELEENPIHMVISDIQMPVLNGLDFARQAKAIDPNLRIILLSQYHEFSYAKAAIDIGVEGYLCKPLEPEELLRTINQLLASLRRDDAHLRYVAGLKDKAALSESMIQEKFFLWLTSQRSSYFGEKELRMKARYFQVEDEAPSYWMAAVGIEENPRQATSLFRDVVYGDSIRQKLLELFPTWQEQPRIFNDAGGHCCLVFRFSDSGHGLRDDIELVARRVLYVLQAELGIEAFIGCSSPGGGLSSLGRCYCEAIYVLKHNIFRKSNDTLKYTELLAAGSRNPIDQHKLRHDLFQHLRSNNRNALSRSLSQVRNTLEQEPVPFYYVKLVYIDLIIIGWTFMREVGARPSAFFSDKQDPTAIVDALQDPGEYHDWICQYFDQILEDTAGSGVSYHQKMVQKVLRLIEEHVGNPALSVKFLAHELYINEDYLGSLFKKQIGTTMVKYITTYRINHACSLLREGCRNVSGVAAACGFADPLYFSKCFRKQMGLSPSEYIRRCGGGKDGRQAQ